MPPAGLYRPGIVENLIAACAALIADKTLREHLGTAASESVKQKFAPDTMVDVIEAVYQKFFT